MREKKHSETKGLNFQLPEVRIWWKLIFTKLLHTQNTQHYYLLDDSQSERNVSETVPNFEVEAFSPDSTLQILSINSSGTYWLV
jgi:hypothetical protein